MTLMGLSKSMGSIEPIKTDQLSFSSSSVSLGSTGIFRCFILMTSKASVIKGKSPKLMNDCFGLSSDIIWVIVSTELIIRPIVYSCIPIVLSQPTILSTRPSNRVFISASSLVFQETILSERRLNSFLTNLLSSWHCMQFILSLDVREMLENLAVWNLLARIRKSLAFDDASILPCLIGTISFSSTLLSPSSKELSAEVILALFLFFIVLLKKALPKEWLNSVELLLIW